MKWIVISIFLVEIVWKTIEPSYCFCNYYRYLRPIQATTNATLTIRGTNLRDNFPYTVCASSIYSLQKVNAEQVVPSNWQTLFLFLSRLVHVNRHGQFEKRLWIALCGKNLMRRWWSFGVQNDAESIAIECNRVLNRHRMEIFFRFNLMSTGIVRNIRGHMVQHQSIHCPLELRRVRQSSPEQPLSEQCSIVVINFRYHSRCAMENDNFISTLVILTFNPPAQWPMCFARILCFHQRRMLSFSGPP